jgi:hypothetical protein
MINFYIIDLLFITLFEYTNELGGDLDNVTGYW